VLVTIITVAPQMKIRFREMNNSPRHRG
jgi:hypothetical protein